MISYTNCIRKLKHHCFRKLYFLLLYYNIYVKKIETLLNFTKKEKVLAILYEKKTGVEKNSKLSLFITVTIN